MSVKKETLFSEAETTNSKQVRLLKKQLPECFDRDGNFIQERMLELINGGESELSRESYSLNWLGKSYARLLTNMPPETLIKQDETHNESDANKDSKNLLIKGDNLEVLKHLTNAYSETVKMIYIDPPYNTGKDGFTYRDDRKFTKEQLSSLAGIGVDEAERILEFTGSKSNSHSAWLTFIYPRLYMARELLADDGTIFISIDDNELSQLKVLCDEVFGEENHLGNIVWKNVTDNNPTNIAVEHEYIVAFSKNREFLASRWSTKVSEIKDMLVKVGEQFISKFPDESDLQKAYTKWFRENKFQLGPLDRYKYIDGDGIYTGSQSVHNPGKEGYRYDIIHPETQKPCKEPLMGYRFPKKTMHQLIEADKILYGADHNKIVELKLYVEEFEEKFPGILELDGRLGSTELRSLFPEVKTIFTNPKPSSLIEKLVSYSTDGEGIILDFFAGSGTTAHAVLSLNAKENTNYRFMSVQLPENTDTKKDAFKAGYKTIFDITKERISRVAEKNRADYSESTSDLGFKIYETVDEFRLNNEQLTLDEPSFFKEEKLTEDNYHTLLTTWCLYDGSPLTTQVIDTNLDTYLAHLCDGRLYMIASDFSIDALKTLLEKLDSDKDFAPHKVIFYGPNFDSVKQMELHEALRSYANKKSIDIDVVARY